MKKLLLALLLLLPSYADAARLFTAANSDKIIYPEPALWTTQISLSMWVYLTTQSVGGQAVMHDDAGTDTARQYTIGLTTTSSAIQYHAPSLILNTLSSTAVVPTGAWTHLVFTVDYTNTAAKIYVNGVSQSVSGSVVQPPNLAAGFPSFGAAYINGSYVAFLDGRLAEPAMWINVPVLNQSEVTALARGARADKVRLNPTRYYPLEGWQSPEPDYGSAHLGTTTITGTSRADGPPLLPR